jgi:FkbM family methyltransferase
MRFRTQLVSALRRTPLQRPTDWLLLHVVPGANERRRHHQIDVETVRFIERVLPPDGNAIDIGAHVGAVLRDIVRVAPHGSHHAVEPLPDLAAQLRAAFPTVVVHECVLGAAEWVADQGQRATINRNVDDPGYSSVARVDHPRVRGKMIETVDVAATTLDEIASAMPDVHLIKLDVEGFELQVLRGGTDLLRTRRPVIVFEHEPVGDTANDTALLFDLLDGADYDVERLVEWRSPRPLARSQFTSAYEQGDSYFIARPRRSA